MSQRRRASNKEDVVSKAKKLRMAPGTADKWICGEFVNGSIVRVQMERFVTYDSCEFYPGPKLNVVLGPNGTGKSSLVCAICLGLAGSTSLLGRSKEVGEFVKHGYNEATIEIELFQDSGNITVKRVIQKEGNRSVWYVNSREVSQRQVVESIKSLNIQVGNLCQFLPQDMVVEFAKMNSSELLQATEKALDCQNLIEKRERLIRTQKNGLKLKLELDSEKKQLEKLNHQQELDKPEVDRFWERKKHMDEIKMLEMKRPWVEYEESRKAYDASRREKKEVQEERDKLRKESEPMEHRVKEATQAAREAENKARDIVQKTNRKTADGREIQDKMVALESDLEEPRKNYESMKSVEAKRLKKIDHWKAEITSFEGELEKALPLEQISGQLEGVVQDLRGVSSELNKLMSERDRIRSDEESVKRQLDSCKQQIHQLEDTRNQREQELRKVSRDTYNALQWLRANQDRFKEPVIEPIMLVVNVKDPSKAKFVEAAIPFRDMTAFVCQNTEDLHLFLQETRERQKLKINAVQPPSEELSQFKPKKPLSGLKIFGFQSYLIDLIEAPHAVLRYLCKTSHIHDIPVGDEQTDQNISDVADRSGLVRFFTPSSSCSVKVSRYGSHDKSTRISTVRNPRFLDVQMDVERHSELQLRCRELRADSQTHSEQDCRLKVKEEQLRKEESRLRQQKKDLLTRKGMKKKLENDIRTRRKLIEDSNSNDAVDLAREECNMKEKMQEVNKERVKLAATLQTIMEECHDLVLKRICLALRHAVLANECERLQAAHRDANSALSEMEERLEQVKHKMLQCKDQAKLLLKKAQDKTGTMAGTQLSAELKQAFQQYPETLDEIDARIHEERARAECNQATNDEVVKKYGERQDVIQLMEVKVEAMEKELQNDEAELGELKKSWLHPLRQRLDDVSKQYGSFFQKMGCASEVSLIEDEDFSKFGISLRVKYRKNEELHELTAHHQSGGERSVATILYLMALQGVTNCPFRVVDEINQGMDPNNERKVFELIVQTVSTLGTSQYFLFSPKLLPDLPFNEHVTVSVVHNGPFMLPHCNWDVEKAMAARKKFVAED